MFGWRNVSAVHETDRRRYGFYLETFSTGLWLNVYWGRRWWSFTRYTRNRHTGPGENGDVLRHFRAGPDRRVKGRKFSSGFAEAAKKPVPRPLNPRYADRFDGGCPGCDDPEC